MKVYPTIACVSGLPTLNYPSRLLVVISSIGRWNSTTRTKPYFITNLVTNTLPRARIELKHVVIKAKRCWYHMRINMQLQVSCDHDAPFSFNWDNKVILHWLTKNIQLLSSFVFLVVLFVFCLYRLCCLFVFSTNQLIMLINSILSSHS